MDFTAQLDQLQKHAADAKKAAQAAAKDSRDQLKKRIDQAQVDLNLAEKDIKQETSKAATSAKSKWNKMKADMSRHREDARKHIDQQANAVDASLAEAGAEWAEDDAINAINYAEWVVDNARLAVLDAIDARAYADEMARSA